MFEDVIATLGAVVDALNTANVAYALCGGLAVNLHGHVRATRDIDLLLPLDQLDPARSALRPLGFQIDAGPIPFSSGTDRERVLYRVSRIRGTQLSTVDLMIVTPVLESAWASRVLARWRSRDVWTVSLDGLARMKRLAGRPQDLADLDNLGLERDDEETP
jgi:aminoglycoside-2''-adenylyltransferase